MSSDSNYALLVIWVKWPWLCTLVWNKVKNKTTLVEHSCKKDVPALNRWLPPATAAAIFLHASIHLDGFLSDHCVLDPKLLVYSCKYQSGIQFPSPDHSTVSDIILNYLFFFNAKRTCHDAVPIGNKLLSSLSKNRPSTDTRERLVGHWTPFLITFANFLRTVRLASVHAVIDKRAHDTYKVHVQVVSNKSNFRVMYALFSLLTTFFLIRARNANLLLCGCTQ